MAAIVSFVSVYYIGATVAMSSQDARNTLQQVSTKNRQIDQPSIFVNNIKPALGMFVPGFGVGLGFYSSYSTGLVFNSAAQLYPLLKGISPLSSFVTPFAALELFSYGLAMSRSGILAYQLLKKRPTWREFTLHTIVEIAIVALILYIGSIIEWKFIQQHQLPIHR
jgi:stage II sporulation SpoM-like protein